MHQSTPKTQNHFLSDFCKTGRFCTSKYFDGLLYGFSNRNESCWLLIVTVFHVTVLSKLLRHELLSAREEMWQERERALRDLFLSHLKNNTFFCHCYKQYGSECISPASSWGLWMISRKQCCVYESSRRHTSQWCKGGVTRTGLIRGMDRRG